MLRNSSVASTLLLAQRFQESGVSLLAMAPSPLSESVNKCYTPLMDNPEFMNNACVSDIVYGIASNSTASGLDGVSLHCKTVEEIIAITKQAVTRDLFIARNVVNPVISGVVDDVNQYLKQVGNRFTNTLSVVMDTYDKLWDSPIFLDFLKPYSETSANDSVGFPDVHPRLQTEQVIDLMRTGSTRFDDKDLMPWIEEIGKEFVAETYNTYLAKASEEPMAGGNVSISVLSDMTPLTRKRLLVLHLLARRLSRQTMDGIIMDIREYENKIDDFLQQTGRLLNRVLDVRGRNKRLNSMVLSWPRGVTLDSTSDVAEIVVNGDLYTKWLEDGGSPEILFGAAVSDHEEDPLVLLEKTEHYKSLWESRAALQQSKMRYDLYNNTVTGLHHAIAKQIAATKEEDLVGTSYDAMHSKLNESLSGVTEHDTLNLYVCVRDLVTKIMFPHTNAKLVLETIDAICADNPKLPVKEAALLATIKILANWYKRQMEVKYIKR